MGYVTIAAAIVATLEAVPKLNVVYDYAAKELKEYPAATVEAIGHRNSFHDLAGNRRSYRFMVRVYYRIEETEQGAADAEHIMRDLIDDIIVALEANPTLSGTVQISFPSEGRFIYQQREAGWVRVVEMEFSSETRINR